MSSKTFCDSCDVRMDDERRFLFSSMSIQECSNKHPLSILPMLTYGVEYVDLCPACELRLFGPLRDLKK